MTDGVLIESTPSAHWAWMGVRLRPAPVLAESRAYPDVEVAQLREEAAAAERAWLAGLWTTANGTRWEVRYTNADPDLPVSCVLLGRVHGTDRAAVDAAALVLRARLCATPGHVRAEPIQDNGQLVAAVQPDRPHPQGAFELRKPLGWALCRRPGDRRYLFDIRGLAADVASWEPIWHELSRLPNPTTICCYLEPYQPSVRVAGLLRDLAVEYARLAQPGPVNPIWNRQPPPEPFAVTAAPGYLAASARYAGRVHRMRMSVVSTGPLDPAFVQQVASITGGQAVCPVAPADLGAAWHNIATVDRGWLPETYRQGTPPEGLTEVERLLCGLGDVGEAGALFRLPQQIPGHLPLFTAPASTRRPLSFGGLEEAAPGTAGERRKLIFVSYVDSDLELVNRLVGDLKELGYNVWLDRSELLPGQRWKREIMRNIDAADFFIGCFSPHYWKPETFMNEELNHALERFRTMPRGRMWFIPAMLRECELPDFSVGVGETLAGALQYADFGKDWDEALRLVTKILGAPTKPTTAP